MRRRWRARARSPRGSTRSPPRGGPTRAGCRRASIQAGVMPGASVVARRSNASASLQLLVLAPVELRKAAHRVDVVGVLAQRAAQRVDGLVLASGAQVIERERDLAALGVALEELLESRVRLATAPQRRERLRRASCARAAAAARAGSPARSRAPPPRSAAAARARCPGPRADAGNPVAATMRLADDLLGFGVASLLAERVAEQAQVIDRARVLLEVFAADQLRAQRPVRPQRLERGRDGCVPRRPWTATLSFQVLVEPFPHPHAGNPCRTPRSSRCGACPGRRRAGCRCRGRAATGRRARRSAPGRSSRRGRRGRSSAS